MTSIAALASQIQDDACEAGDVHATLQAREAARERIIESATKIEVQALETAAVLREAAHRQWADDFARKLTGNAGKP